MAILDENPRTPSIQQNPRNCEVQVVSQTSSSHPKASPSPTPPPPKKVLSPKEAITAVASRVAAQPLPCSDSDVWGVLTAISNNARKRPQGINILLTTDEHCIGRVVDDIRFQIESVAVSQRHCEIFRRKVTKEDVESPSGFCFSAFIKDSSTNGTFINWDRLKRGSSMFEARINHGDIVSFAAPPEHEKAFAFVYREVLSSVPSSDGTILKRKAEEFSNENKRLKGIGIGAPEGPVSLDDFRSLQRSNTELRKQLESDVLTIDALRNESREALVRHENEMKELKESISKSYLDQLYDLNASFEITKKELIEVNKTSSDQKHTIEDLNDRLSAALQSCTEANEMMKSQKTSIAELKTQLDEERDQRREEREKAAADLRTSILRVQSEAQDELKRVSDTALLREREQQEVINKLQESEREHSSFIESLRSKLEETREKLVLTDNRVRQLEAQVSEEQHASTVRKKQVEELEIETRRMRNELDREKAAREEAWAKASALELEINAAMRDLDFERRRLKGAKERIMLRETQLRAFYSTTEAIATLFSKQQEQLKAMQRTLEDEDNYDNTSLDTFLNAAGRNPDEDAVGVTEPIGYRNTITGKAGISTLAPKLDQDEAKTSTDEASSTEKHDCDNIRSQDDENTQEAEFPNDDHDGLVKEGAFGSDIDGVGTAPIFDVEGDADGTERVPETESTDGERNIDLNKPGILTGDTMQLEDDTNVQETEQQTPIIEDSPNNREELMKATEDTEPETIRTHDLLALEVVGSWGCSTPPSVYGENESPPHRENNERETHAVTHNSNTQVAESPVSNGDKESSGNNERETHAITPGSNNTQVAESQSNPSGVLATTRMHSSINERQALSDMIGIMNPDVKEQFGSAVGNASQEKNAKVSDSDTETDDECIEASKDVVEVDGGSGSDDETQVDGPCDNGVFLGKNDVKDDDMEVDDDDDDDDTQEDSVG